MSHKLEDLFSVKGKTVLVTGGGRGIGFMIAQGFVENGANVYISSRKDDICKSAASKLTKLGPGKCFALPSSDLSTVDACFNLAENLKKSGVKSLDILVNNAGVTWAEPLEAFSEKGWDRVMNLNVKGLFFTIKYCMPLLKAAASKENPARIINIGSIVGITPDELPLYSYVTSKGAVHHLTKKLAKDLINDNINVNAIAPGLFLSDMGGQLKTYMSEEDLVSVVPKKRAGNTSDIAALSIFLSSKGSSWMTGNIIPIDGGHLTGPGTLTAKL